jgi:hypothetical protein
MFSTLSFCVSLQVFNKKYSATAMHLAFQQQIAPNIYNLCSKKEAKKFEANLIQSVSF